MQLLLNANSLRIPLRDESVQVAVTSPPYWMLREYAGEQGARWPEVIYQPMIGVAPVTVPAMHCDLGGEADPLAYIAHLVLIFREVYRVLRKDGILWLNIDDTYIGNSGLRNVETMRQQRGLINSRTTGQPAGYKKKSKVGIPEMLVLALVAEGWIYRKDVIWHKDNAMPESMTDRPTHAHEYVYFLTKSGRYWYDHRAIKEPLAETTIKRGVVKYGGGNSKFKPRSETDPMNRGGHHQWGRTYHLDTSSVDGRNKRSVWTISTESYNGPHNAVFPRELVKICLLASTTRWGCCSKCGRQRTPDGKITCKCQNATTVRPVVLDPFSGAGTTGVVAHAFNLNYVGLELGWPSLLEAQARLSVEFGNQPLRYQSALAEEPTSLPLFPDL